MTDNEVQVSRIPEIGKQYEATFWSRKDPSKNAYYASANMGRTYVGEYITTLRSGGGDHPTYAVFLKDGQKVRIEMDAEGRRAFREVFPVPGERERVRDIALSNELESESERQKEIMWYNYITNMQKSKIINKMVGVSTQKN